MKDTLFDEDDSNRSPRKFVASAVAIGTIVALGVFLTLSNLLGEASSDSSSSTDQPQPSDSVSSTPSSTSTKHASDSVCGLPATELNGTVNTAPAATWSLVGTIAAPSITGHGPGRVDDDGYRACFARTPTGAVAAAANIIAVASYSPIRQKFYEGSTVPGPGRDVLLAEPIGGASSGSDRIQIEGFRVLRYNGDQADVDIAVRTTSGVIAATVVNLQWSEGDWKVRVADDGTELSPVVLLPSLSGYIFWSGA